MRNIRFIISSEGTTCLDRDIPLRRLAHFPLDAFGCLIADNIWFRHPIARTEVQSFLDWLEGVPSYSLRFSDTNKAGMLLGQLAVE